MIIIDDASCTVIELSHLIIMLRMLLQNHYLPKFQSKGLLKFLPEVAIKKCTAIADNRLRNNITVLRFSTISIGVFVDEARM